MLSHDLTHMTRGHTHNICRILERSRMDQYASVLTDRVELILTHRLTVQLHKDIQSALDT